MPLRWRGVAMSDPVFGKGDKVTPLYITDYRLTVGKVYVVVTYDPPFSEEAFTWPAFVQLHDDLGRFVTAHARRFKLA